MKNVCIERIKMIEFISGIFVGILIIVIGLNIVNPKTDWENKIIKAGHGEFNSTTGKFQFLPACKK